MRVVLDTNVLVSGVLTPYGPPGQLLDLVLAGELTLVVEPRILHEYRTVLVRPRFKLNPAHVQSLVDTLEEAGLAVNAFPWRWPLHDRSDEVFLAAADAGRALLVTCNTADFPPAKRGGVAVLTPRECLERLR